MINCPISKYIIRKEPLEHVLRALPLDLAPFSLETDDYDLEPNFQVKSLSFSGN